MSPEWLSALSSVALALTGFVGTLVALSQLKKLNETLRLNALLGVIEIEAEINLRRSRLADVVQEIEHEGKISQPLKREVLVDQVRQIRRCKITAAGGCRQCTNSASKYSPFVHWAMRADIPVGVESGFSCKLMPVDIISGTSINRL